MPKKSATAHAGAQRSKPKVQKNFELVRQTSEDQKLADSSDNESTSTKVSTATISTPKRQKEKESTASTASTASPAVGNTSARLATRHQPTQRSQQRSVAPLITAEHYDYVRKDLIIIGVLASVMFAAIIILYFVLGTGA